MTKTKRRKKTKERAVEEPSGSETEEPSGLSDSFRANKENRRVSTNSDIMVDTRTTKASERTGKRSSPTATLAITNDKQAATSDKQLKQSEEEIKRLQEQLVVAQAAGIKKNDQKKSF